MKFFWIPARDSAFAEAELNAFLTASRVQNQSNKPKRGKEVDRS